MKVLIFGGNGFLGNALTSLLYEMGFEYCTVSRSDSKSSYNLDISDFEEYSKLPNNFFNIVINCATILPGGNYLDNDYLEKIYKTNILGTQNICKWIDGQSSVTKIINCSTLVVVAKPWPLNLTEEEFTYPSGNHVLYCTSKLTQELIFKTFASAKKIVLSQIRFSALYGETMAWNGVICNMIDQAKENKKIILKNGSKVTVDFLHIDDAAKIILATINSDYNGILNGASGNEVSILELANIIARSFIDTVEIVNIEEENINENRSLISIDKLKKIIDTSLFVNLSDGIQKMTDL